MKFPERGSKHFSDEEIERIKVWKKNMELTPIRNRIIENFEEDPHVPDHIWTRFLENLVSRLKEGDNDLDSLRKSITDDMLLKGPIVGRDALEDTLSNLMKVKTLLKRYLKENIPVFKDKKGEEQVGKWINDGTVTKEKHFKNEKLRGARPLLWATFARNIDDELSINDNIDDLCDRLGLQSFNKCDHVVEFRYSADKIKDPRLPTVIDSDGKAVFRPSSEGDPVGYTHDLKNKREGFPEIVHEPIDKKIIDSIRYLGHKTRNASNIFHEKTCKGETK